MATSTDKQIVFLDLNDLVLSYRNYCIVHELRFGAPYPDLYFVEDDAQNPLTGDDPPFLTVGTEVSAKYKGAFCEAKVRKVVRSVKCKVTFKLGLGTAIITDDQIRGTLRVGSVCEVKHPDKKEFVEATINKIQDCSQYTVVFDDGDITTLRRTALCLKSGRHFAESETLDQLPLTHPEHFGNPVIGGRKGRRSRQTQ
ncbi:AT-rich interactive domain-containing protein 4B [Blattella germanica]|nr:AT-rich interactive domain-containing protein 4B [Blattella germanica]